MSSNSSGSKLEGFFTGKGFYIVLFLCAAVIGVSAWMMAAGDKTMKEDVSELGSTRLDNQRVETVIIPPQDISEEADSLEEPVEPAAPPAQEETEQSAAVPEESTQVWREGDVMEVAAPVYVWPVTGSVTRSHSLEALAYDETMADWRTHNGIDIAAPVGTTVTAAHAGAVSSVAGDDLFGTVVTVDHGDGSATVYANLDPNLSVTVGDWVEPGAVIGTVGSTALCEVSQEAHLHFAISVDGRSVDPLNYLPA